MTLKTYRHSSPRLVLTDVNLCFYSVSGLNFLHVSLRRFNYLKKKGFLHSTLDIRKYSIFRIYRIPASGEKIEPVSESSCFALDRAQYI